jgi:hypothetical protein
VLQGGADLAHLRQRVRQQTHDLALQRARAQQVAEPRIGARRQQIARHVEGARPHGAAILGVVDVGRALARVALQEALGDSAVRGLVSGE